MSRPLLEQVVAARVEEVPGLVQAAGAAAVAAGLEPHRARRVELAVEEAAVNICRHAYGGQGGPLRVRALAESGYLLLELSDEGAAFDPLAQPPADLTASLEDRAVGGLGIHLIRRVTDEVRYKREHDRNILTLLFRLAP